MVGVYDGRHGADCAVGIEYDGVDGRVPYYVEISREMFVVLVASLAIVACPLY